MRLSSVGGYGVALVVVVALIAWVVLDHRVQRRQFAGLEARGVTRRSAPYRASRPHERRSPQNRAAGAAPSAGGAAAADPVPGVGGAVSATGSARAIRRAFRRR